MKCFFYYFLSLFFFFQAEDGIRDYKVTGVQTCALPISRASRRTTRPRRWRCPSCSRGSTPAPPSRSGRSEERRVGKGCRVRLALLLAHAVTGRQQDDADRDTQSRVRIHLESLVGPVAAE